MASIGRTLGDSAIRFYQRHISRDYNAGNNAACIFEPSCSEFTRQSVENLGLQRGTVEGAMRLMRCNHEVRDHHHEELLGLLRGATLEVAHQRIRCDGEDAEKVLSRLKFLADEEMSLVVRNPAPQDRLHDIQHERADLLRDLHVIQSDPAPTASGTSGETTWRLRVRKPVAPTAEPGLARGGLRALGGLVGGIVGGAAGLVTGLTVGGTIGVAACTGGLERYNAHVGEQWPESRARVESVERPMSFVGSSIRKALGGGTLGAAVAMPFALPAGLVAGAFLGIAAGAKVGARMGSAAGGSV